MIAIAVATVVVAATAVTGIFVLGGDDDDTAQQADDASAPSADPTEDPEEEQPDRNPDDPRQGMTQKPDPVVAPDWQVQTIYARHNAFDVPPDWQVNSEGTRIGITDDREKEEEEEEEEPEEEGDDLDFDFEMPEVLVSMSGVSFYQENWCPEADGATSRAMAGTKGAQGARGTAEAAETEALHWALSAYDQNEEGDLEVSDPEPFTSDHGIEGHTVTATITNVPEDPDFPCESYDGKVVTVSYLTSQSDLATWVLVADTGFDEELEDETIEKIMNSLRPYPQKEDEKEEE